MSEFEVLHHDPSPRARAAAVRSVREQDPLTRSRAREQDMPARLREGLRLARFAERARGRVG